MAKILSIVTPGFNESDNIADLCQRIRAMMREFPDLELEHIFIDNASTDDSVEILRKLASQDPTLKVILNARNFGHIRSPFHAILQASGDAVVLMASDLQDPPELVAEFIREWQSKRTPICIAVKTTSEESMPFFLVRKVYYRLLAKVSESPQIQNFTGFGLYDRRVVEVLKQFREPYPFFRGMIAEVGFRRREFEFKQPLRRRGFTKNNLLTLYDIGMLGITSERVGALASVRAVAGALGCTAGALACGAATTGAGAERARSADVRRLLAAVLAAAASRAADRSSI